jgi:CheY-like chemotaxis protein
VENPPDDAQCDWIRCCEALRADEDTRGIPVMVLTAKLLTKDDKKALNGQVAAIFKRDSFAGPELTAWLRDIVAKRRNP